MSSRFFAPSVAFALTTLGSAPPMSACAGLYRRGRLHLMLRTARSLPRLCGAFDAGLHTGPSRVPHAGLLSGLLAVTRAGIAPAGDDELALVCVSHLVIDAPQLLDARGFRLSAPRQKFPPHRKKEFRTGRRISW